MPEGRLRRTREAYREMGTQVVAGRAIRCCPLCLEALVSESMWDTGVCRHLLAAGSRSETRCKGVGDGA